MREPWGRRGALGGESAHFRGSGPWGWVLAPRAVPAHPMCQLVGLVEPPHLLQHQVLGLGAGQLAVEPDAHQVGHAEQQPGHLPQLLACVLHAARPGVVDEEDAVGTAEGRGEGRWWWGVCLGDEGEERGKACSCGLASFHALYQFLQKPTGSIPPVWGPV